jgi:Glycosyl hydrolases family 43/Calcineurin-like phosphoesterase
MVFLFPVLASILISAPAATKSAPDTTQPKTSSFLLISDIHLDPLKKQTDILPAARNAGSDTWDTAQQAITQVLTTEKPSFIIYLGDLPRHAIADSIVGSMADAGKTLTDLRNIATRSNTPLLFVPGNNDSPDSDYGQFSPSLFQNDPEAISAWPAVGTTTISTTLYQELGCYSSYPLGPNTKLRIIVLNTVLYTWNYQSPNHNVECQEQIAWLGQQLRQTRANHEMALIAMHVPPGQDTYKHASFWTTKPPVNNTTIQNSFLDTIDRYHTNIIGLLASHTHMDGFKRLYNKDKQFIALLISDPGIAPSASNNSAFKLIRYDNQYRLMASDTYFHNPGQPDWQVSTIESPDNQPLTTYISQMDTTQVRQLVDTIFNAGKKFHNNNLDIDVRRDTTRPQRTNTPSQTGALPSQSGNPIFPGWYADPEAAVFDSNYWVYPTFSDKYNKQVFFDAFSSPDLVQWTKHPHILDTTAVRWAKRAMWAPAITEKNGRYYFFFAANDIQNDSAKGGIGVAVAPHPQGPYKDYLGKPLIGQFHNGAQPIDQAIFHDKDGQYYMIYGGWGHCNIARLRSDFKALLPFPDGKTYKEITPEGYVEGPYMIARDGKYYFMWSEGGWGGPDYSVAYAMADNPTGPFQRIGKILQQDSAVATGAGHHSVIHIPGTDDYYIVYHRRPLGETDPNHRVVCIDRLEFTADGHIRPVHISKDGVAARPLR